MLKNDTNKNKNINTNYEYTGDLPLGLGMALAHNIPAMKVFSGLSEDEKNIYIERAKTVTSRNEMNALVNTLLK